MVGQSLSVQATPVTPPDCAARGLRYLRALALLALLCMALALVYGLASGDFGREARALAGMPWGLVAIIDVYIGLLFFSVWMIFRERNWPRGALWLLAFLGLGNLATAVYVIKALNEANGRLAVFLYGPRGAG